MVACVIKCQCGGEVGLLSQEDGSFIYYFLTEELTIIFRGVCNQCGQPVSVERDIRTLMLMCPTKGKGN